MPLCLIKEITVAIAGHRNGIAILTAFERCHDGGDQTGIFGAADPHRAAVRRGGARPRGAGDGGRALARRGHARARSGQGQRGAPGPLVLGDDFPAGHRWRALPEMQRWSACRDSAASTTATSGAPPRRSSSFPLRFAPSAPLLTERARSRASPHAGLHRARPVTIGLCASSADLEFLGIPPDRADRVLAKAR